jgi:hypothetical protein
MEFSVLKGITQTPVYVRLTSKTLLLTLSFGPITHHRSYTTKINVLGTPHSVVPEWSI